MLREVLKARPDVRVLVLSSYNDRAYIESMLAAGARGYLLKEEAPALLLKAIRSIDAQSTGAWLSPQASGSLPFPSLFEQEISWRELAILQRLLDGESQAEIAFAVNLPEPKFGEHLQLLMQKLGAPTLVALMDLARRTFPPAS